MDLSKNDRLVVPGVDVLTMNVPRFCWLEWQEESQTLRVSIHEEWWPELVARIAQVHQSTKRWGALPGYGEPLRFLKNGIATFGFGHSLTMVSSRFGSKVHVTLPYRSGMGLAEAYSLAEVLNAIASAPLPFGHGRTFAECRDVPRAQAQMIVVDSMVVMPLWKKQACRLNALLSSAAREELRSLYNDRDVQDLQDTVKQAMLSATAKLFKKGIGKVPEKCNCVVHREEGTIRVVRCPGVRLGDRTVSGLFITLAGYAALDHWLVQNVAIR